MMHIRLRLAFMLSESDPPNAEKYFRKAIEAQSTLIRHFPQVSIYKFGLTFILDSLARFYQQQGRLPEAQSMLRESIALIKENLQNHPEAHPLRGILARNYAVLADLLRTTGDEQAAAEADEQAKLLRTGR
jgi:tetratricopeptide (TPR) repeat protein